MEDKVLFFLRNALYGLVALYGREVLGAGGQAAGVRILFFVDTEARLFPRSEIRDLASNSFMAVDHDHDLRVS